METDAVPDLPSHEGKKPSSKNQSSHSTQHVYGNVFNFTGSKNLHFGNVINIGTKKKSGGTNKEKLPKKCVKQLPQFISVVLKKCIDVLSTNDIQIIKDLIKCSSNDFAKIISTHPDIGDINLPHSDAIQKVLSMWIEEHDDSALVAILLANLLTMKENEAAATLARAHFQTLTFC